MIDPVLLRIDPVELAVFPLRFILAFPVLAMAILLIVILRDIENRKR